MPSIVGGYGMPLGSLSARNRGVERLDGESFVGDDDKIRVVTRVDVSISAQRQDSCAKDGRESSTESLFRNSKLVV